MNMKKKLPYAFALILLAGSLGNPTFAQDGTAALGATGEIFLPQVGAYKDLFPKGHDTTPNNTVLAVDFIQPGATAQRLLVPFTKGEDIESSPAVLFEDDSNTLFLLWASEVNPLSSVLMLASFDGVNWGQPIQITGNPFSSKTSAQLAITHDSFSVTDSSGNTATRHRTIVHIFWKEHNANGNADVLYTPVILDEGTYLGWAPVYNLNDMVGRSTLGLSFAPPDALVQLPVLQSGRDSRMLLVGFASSDTRTLSAVEIDVLPEEISLLAEGCRANIIDLGHNLYPNDLQVLADKASADLGSRGTAFHADIAQYIATQVHNLVLADRGSSPADLASLSEKIRANIIDLGSRLSGRGLRDPNTYNKALAESIVSVSPTDPAAPSHLIHFRVASNRPAPQMGSTGTQFFLSETGDDAIVAWTDSGKVVYLQSQGTGWSDQKQINLSSSVDAPHAFAILKQKARSR
ncbi:MAG TPA: hypothetical protein VGS07_17325 [Thermoanaerobaculia bacterium]|jgi:hypothetical protein|nr:hypothetical protein [Thermoanaerobaculia bacterium]